MISLLSRLACKIVQSVRRTLEIVVLLFYMIRLKSAILHISRFYWRRFSLVMHESNTCQWRNYHYDLLVEFEDDCIIMKSLVKKYSSTNVWNRVLFWEGRFWASCPLSPIFFHFATSLLFHLFSFPLPIIQVQGLGSPVSSLALHMVAQLVCVVGIV